MEAYVERIGEFWLELATHRLFRQGFIDSEKTYLPLGPDDLKSMYCIWPENPADDDVSIHVYYDEWGDDFIFLRRGRGTRLVKGTLSRGVVVDRLDSALNDLGICHGERERIIRKIDYYEETHSLVF